LKVTKATKKNGKSVPRAWAKGDLKEKQDLSKARTPVTKISKGN